MIEKNVLYIDLLPQRKFLHYARHVGSLREEILAWLRKHPAPKNAFCIIDEVQKLPALLDEVHELIESFGIRFILIGSSARKLRRGGANLLAGRANTYHLYPLTFGELGAQFDVEQAMRTGCLPVAWQLSADDRREFLIAYSETYLKEEIAAEGLVRQIGPFSRFMDIAASCDGETVNYSNIARECAVTIKTVQQYYQILEDTFLAHKIPAWRRSARKRLVAHPRYYLFDCGISNALCHTLGRALSAKTRGRRFEQMVITQLLAAIHYNRLDYQLFYWRTNHGAEVDILICQGKRILAAVEIKSMARIGSEKLTGLLSFLADQPTVPGYVLGINQPTRLIGERVQVMDWTRFINQDLAGLSG